MTAPQSHIKSPHRSGIRRIRTVRGFSSDGSPFCLSPGTHSRRSVLSRLRSSSPATAQRHMRNTPSIPPTNSPPINDSQCMVSALLPAPDGSVRPDRSDLIRKQYARSIGNHASETKNPPGVRLNRFGTGSSSPAADKGRLIRLLYSVSPFPATASFPFCASCPRSCLSRHLRAACAAISAIWSSRYVCA